MTLNSILSDDEIQECIRDTISNKDVKIFIKTLAPDDNDRMVRLKTNHVFQAEIEQRIRNIIINNSEISGSQSEIVKELVWNLVDNHEENSVRRYWESFFLGLAKKVASNKWGKYADRINYLDFQDYCLSSIVGTNVVINNFVKQIPTYRTRETNLLSRIKAYVYGTIKNSLLERLREELKDPTIGRSNKYLAVNFGNKKTKIALGVSIVDKIDIDRYCNLRECVKEHLRKERQTNKDRKIKVNKLEPEDLKTISESYKKITGNESPPILETLDLIGEAVRRHVQNPLPELLPTEPKRLPPEILITQCDRWLTDEEINGNLTSRDKQILYLHYHFDLFYRCQGKIAPIFNVTQGNISRPLSQIHAGITQYILDYLSKLAEESNREISSEDRCSMTGIAASVIKDIKLHFDRLRISQEINHESRLQLEELIQVYQEYLQYLERLYIRHPSLLSSLKSSDRYKYERQLQNLEILSQSECLEVNIVLTRASFIVLIEDIQNILPRLWNGA